MKTKTPKKKDDSAGGVKESLSQALSLSMRESERERERERSLLTIKDD